MRAKALFIFPTEFTADLKKFSLEEKNRKKVISSRIHNETNLNSFKSTYSRALLRSLQLFALISFYLVWLRISSHARERGIFRSHYSSLFSARLQRKREIDRERKISLAHTHKEGFCMARSFAGFFLRWCECDFVFLFVLGWFEKLNSLVRRNFFSLKTIGIYFGFVRFSLSLRY